MKSKHLNDKDTWMLAEHIPDSDIFFFQIPFSCFTNDTSYSFIKRYSKVLAVFKRFEMNFYFGERNSNEVAESILKALIEQPRFRGDLNKNIVMWSKTLMTFARATTHMPLADFTNQKLWRLYEEHDRIHTKLYTYGWIPVALDMFHNNFTKWLKRYLATRCESAHEVEEAFIVLTTPTKKTIVAKEREKFLKMYEKYYPEFKKMQYDAHISHASESLIGALAKHAAEWGHLGYIYAGNHPAFGVEHYFKELIDLALSNVKSNDILKKEEVYLHVAKKKKTRMYRILKIDAQHRLIFEVASEFTLTKLVRRHAQLSDLYLLHKGLLAEIAKRLKLTRYQVQFMLKDEIKKALFFGAVNRHILAERLKYCVYYTERGVEDIYTGLRAQKFIKSVECVKNTLTNEIMGQTAQIGYAKGIVKIIIRAKDMSKMRQGNILVSIATDPDIVPAMKKAAAIITEQGGITSHAAIVSRELGIPCVIGTKIATKVFKDGDLVEVDAEKGVVRKIEKSGE